MGNLKTGIVKLALWVFFTLGMGYLLTRVMLHYNFADPFAFKFDNFFDYLGSFFLILDDLEDIIALREGEFIGGLDVVLMNAFLGAGVAGWICLGFEIGKEMEILRVVLDWILGLNYLLPSVVFIVICWTLRIFLVVFGGLFLGWFMPVTAIIYIIVGIIRKN